MRCAHHQTCRSTVDNLPRPATKLDWYTRLLSSAVKGDQVIQGLVRRFRPLQLQALGCFLDALLPTSAARLYDAESCGR